MRLRELFTEVAAPKQLGRAFNHLEDLVFFYGSAGVLEALSHIEDFASEGGASSIRMKWDGNPQIYWGRETKGGPLILSGHNGWSRGAKTDSAESLKDFIANKSGQPKTPEEQTARNKFAQEFANLYPLFDKATPKDFVGFVYADGLFLQRPSVDNEGVYTFCPNPKSKTCYHVTSDSDLGRRINNAQVMVVGHAEFSQFGAADSEQQPKDDFSAFNKTPTLIVLGPVYNKDTIKIDTASVNDVKKYLQQHGAQIDQFLTDTPGLSDLKNGIFYPYVNQTARAKQLDDLGEQHFMQWLANSKVSAGKQEKIKAKLDSNPQALEAMFTLVKMIQNMKDQIIDQLEQSKGEVWDTNGEGRVRYADPSKKFGNVKLVPRKRWTPA
jgi:hypothetical protein